MSSAGTEVELLQQLPGASTGRLGMYIVQPDGSVTTRVGHDDELQFRAGEDRPTYTVPDGRMAVDREASNGDLVVITFDAEQLAQLEPFFRVLFDLLEEKEQVESDMESMYSSSLALLEEVSMVGEMLPRLSAGEDEQDIAEMGTSALMVAASVERAIYMRVDKDVGQAEVLVQVVARDGGRNTVVEPYAADELVFESDGDSVMWRAVRGHGGAILESVVDPDSLGPMGSPERLAQRQVIAVPIRYGSGDKAVTLGALLIMDKRPNAYSTSTELGSQETKLASSVGAMLGSVLGTRKVAHLRKELEMGKEMQQQILPSGAPSLRGYDLAGLCTTSQHVGGDYYDFLPLPDGRTMAVIADVSGHNLPSGMMMVSARTTLRLLTSRETDCASVFDELAGSLYPDLTKTERFITAAGVTLAEGNHDLEIVNAGHNPTLIYRAATGEIEEVGADDTVLGFLPSPAHGKVTAQMVPGDFAVLYTDGVTEAVNADGEMFGEERLKGVLRSSARGSAANILSAVFGAVEFHADKTNNDDDITAVVIKARPQGNTQVPCHASKSS